MRRIKKVAGRRMGGKKRGFTLIELLIVIAILAVLSAVVALSLTGFIGRGETQACEADESAIQTAVYSFYYESDGDWPTSDTNVPGDIVWTASDGSGGTFNVNYLSETPSSDTTCDWQLLAGGQVCTNAGSTACGCGTACSGGATPTPTPTPTP